MASVTVPYDLIYIKLPYLRTFSHNLERKLIRTIHNDYTTVNLKAIYTSSLTLGSIFRFKDKFSNYLYPSTVYKHTCGNCNATSMGKTSCNLVIRT